VFSWQAKKIAGEMAGDADQPACFPKVYTTTTTLLPHCPFYPTIPPRPPSKSQKLDL
jgi:hypothetical protein